MNVYSVVLLFFFHPLIHSAGSGGFVVNNFGGFYFLLSTKSRSCLAITDIILENGIVLSAERKEFNGKLLDRFCSIRESEIVFTTTIDAHFAETRMNVQDAFSLLERDELEYIVDNCVNFVRNSFNLRKAISEALSTVPETEIYEIPKVYMDELERISLSESHWDENFARLFNLIVGIQEALIMPHCISLFFVEEFLRQHGSSQEKIPGCIKVEDIQRCQDFYLFLLLKYEMALKNIQTFKMRKIPKILWKDEISLKNFSIPDTLVCEGPQNIIQTAFSFVHSLLGGMFSLKHEKQE